MKKNARYLCLMVLWLSISLLNITSPRAYSATIEDTETKSKPTYLSDLEPIPGSSDYIVDRDAEGNSLQLPIVEFTKGLCVATDSELIYLIDGKYSNFQVTIGHSASYPEFEGKLIFTILGDDKVLYESKTMSSKDNERITVNVGGVRNLVLRVKSDGATSQFVIWGDPLLY